MGDGSQYAWYNPQTYPPPNQSAYPPVSGVVHHAAAASLYPPNPSPYPQSSAPYPPPNQAYPPPQSAYPPLQSYDYGPAQSYPPSYAQSYPPYPSSAAAPPPDLGLPVSAPSFSAAASFSHSASFSNSSSSDLHSASFSNSCSSDLPSHPENNSLEELRHIARLFFDQNPNQREFLRKYGFSDCLSRPHDTRVSLPALHKSIPDAHLSRIFSLLDHTHTGYVDFWGLLTILYAVDSKLFCDHCHALILGAKFWCEECRVGDSKALFGLCFTCFSNQKGSHKHQEFYNSHSLLKRFMVASMLKAATMKRNHGFQGIIAKLEQSENKQELHVPKADTQQKEESVAKLEHQMSHTKIVEQQREMAKIHSQFMASLGNAISSLAGDKK